jgi:hypothetical protein
VRLARLRGKLVDHRGNAPRPDCLQGDPAPLCVARAQSWFRANLSAASTRRCHQISFLSEVMRRVRRRVLVRIEGIEPPSPEWRSGAQPIDQIRVLRCCCKLVGSGWNRTSCPKGTAFTARRRHQPVLTGTSRIVLIASELAESRGLDPHTLRCLPASNGCRTPVRLTFRMSKMRGAPSNTATRELAED